MFGGLSPFTRLDSFFYHTHKNFDFVEGDNLQLTRSAPLSTRSVGGAEKDACLRMI